VIIVAFLEPTSGLKALGLWVWSFEWWVAPTMSKLQGPQTVIFALKLEPNVPPHHGRAYNISCQRIADPNPYGEHSRRWLLRLTVILPQFVEWFQPIDF
jgi:hypothetical protein